MASQVEIVRMALSHIADAARVQSIAPPDNSVAAQHAATFYPQARDEILEAAAWPFACRIESLTLSSDQPDPDVESWGYSYQLPDDHLRTLKVLLPGDKITSANQPYEERTDSTELDMLIFTDAEDARIYYIYREEQTGRYTPLFISALSYLLASYLAGPLVKGATGVRMANSLKQTYASVLSAAAMRALRSGGANVEKYSK